MKQKKILTNCALICSGMAVLFLSATPAQADTIWTNWTNFSLGTGGGGSATGSVGGVAVSYAGELDAGVVNGSSPIWSPNSSFIGGTVTTSPSVMGDDLRIDGTFTGINTITFASAVENPLFAIWSLGAPNVGASFTFTATPTLQAGGPNSQYGGSPLIVLGNLVSGNEGNGVVQFTGTYSSISWTNTFENYYAFTVGVNGPETAAVPEPRYLSLSLVLIGLVALAYRRGFAAKFRA